MTERFIELTGGQIYDQETSKEVATVRVDQLTIAEAAEVMDVLLDALEVHYLRPSPVELVEVEPPEDEPRPTFHDVITAAARGEWPPRRRNRHKDAKE